VGWVGGFGVGFELLLLLVHTKQHASKQHRMSSTPKAMRSHTHHHVYHSVSATTAIEGEVVGLVEDGAEEGELDVGDRKVGALEVGPTDGEAEGEAEGAEEGPLDGEEEGNEVDGEELG
jgi:hypothetical protein